MAVCGSVYNLVCNCDRSRQVVMKLRKCEDTGTATIHNTAQRRGGLRAGYHAVAPGRSYHQATSLGFLPATFSQFLQHVSTNEDIPTTRLVSLVSKSLRSHTYRMLRKHRQLTLAHRMHGAPTLPTLPYSQGHAPTTTLRTPPKSQEPEPPPDDDPLSHLYYREDDSPHVEGD